MKSNNRFIVSAALVLAFGGATFGRGQVVLQLIDPATDSSNVIITGTGQSFSLDADVSGLTSPALDGLDFTLGPLPAGVTLISFSDAPANWTFSPNVFNPLSFSEFANSTADDISGDATLIQYNFMVTETPTAGTIDFVAEQSGVQDLIAPDFSSIDFTQSGATLSDAAVPEPSTYALLATGFLSLGVVSRYLRKKSSSRSL
jgi:hypothetical protein